VHGVGRHLRLAQQPGQDADQGPALGVLVGEPGVADGLLHLVEVGHLGRGVQERVDLVVALQRGADLRDLRRLARPGGVHTVVVGFPTEQQLRVDLQHLGDVVDDRELVEPADAPLHLVHPALALP